MGSCIALACIAQAEILNHPEHPKGPIMKLLYSTAAALLVLSPVALAAPELKGRIMIDHAFFDGVHNDNERGSAWEIRRARLGIKHKPSSNWEAELELNIDNDDESVNITDGYVQYTGWGFGDITFGHMKEAFGLENTTSSMDISTLERSVVTEAFKPGRNFGIEFANDSDIHSLNLGVFESGEDENGLSSYAFTGRITFAPVKNETTVVHLGFSGSMRDMQGDDYEINEPLEVNTAGKHIESREIAAETINQSSIEAAVVYKRLSLQTEWMQQEIKEMAPADLTEQASGNVELSGYYFLASYFITGESRAYDDGSFDEVKPASPRGAWEVVSRFSSIDLMNMDEGANATSVLVGVNYYATGRARLMLNVARGEIVNSDIEKSGTGNSVSFRAQYEF